MAVRPKRITSSFKNRKKVTDTDTSATIEENIQLEMFPHPIPREFLSDISPYLKIMKSMNRCVIYYDSPSNDMLQSGYYEVIRFERAQITIMTSLYGEYTVSPLNCFLTQELLYAYKKGIALRFDSVSLSSESEIIKELRAEAWDCLLINSDDLL